MALKKEELHGRSEHNHDTLNLGGRVIKMMKALLT